MRKFVAMIGLATALTLGTSACYGKFGLFKKVHQWNGTLGGPVVNSLVHFVFWIVPVYELVILGDLLIFNTIEFFTGSNPMADASMEIDEDRRIVRLHAEDGRVLEVAMTGEHEATIALDGEVVGSAVNQADGSWLLHDERGQRTLVASAGDLASAHIPAAN